MSNPLLPLVLFTAALVLIVLGGGGAFLLYWIKQKNAVRKALNLVLITVRLPILDRDDTLTADRIRERIGIMEQLYAGLGALKSSGWFSARPWIAFEMTVPAKDAELSFYIAVPRALADTTEKLVHAYYPDAAVERTKDYNIFTPRGVVLLSQAEFKEKGALPIKTYKTLETDPLKAVTSVFTKLNDAREGAAFQIVLRPASGEWRKRLLAEATRLYKGESKVKSEREIFSDIAFGPGEKKPEIPKPPERTPIDEARAKALEEKAGKPLFEANVRLVASSPNAERTSVILQSLEQAFSQFEDPMLNGIRFVREKPRKAARAVFKYSFRLFDEKKSIVLSAPELTSLYHFPNAPIEVPGVESVRAKDLPPPEEISKEGILLGYNLFRGVETPVRLSREDRRRHLYIIGQTGTGKSNFLKHQIAQDIKAGEGVSVIDPHGELAEYALGFVPDHRASDVIYFDPGDTSRPMGLNMLEYDPRFPEQKTLLINELLAIFDKLFNMSVAGGPAFEQYFRNAAQLVMDDPETGNTLLDLQRVFADKKYRDLKLSRSSNVVVRSFWTQIAEKAGGEQSLQNMAPYITNKFDVFLSNDIMRPIVAQQKSSFDFRSIMDERKILLINLSKGRLGEINSSLLGLILVGKLLLAALSRTNIAEESRPDFYLYIDEFQNVTTKSIATILSEARKYRLDMIMTHQFIGQLEEDIKKAVFGNVGSMAAFRIGTEDSEFMEKQFVPSVTARDLITVDNFKAYVRLLIGGKTSRPFSLSTYPAEKTDAARVERLKQLSRERYGKPREEVEADIVRRRLSGI